MIADPIETLCLNLKDELTKIRERRIVGRISFEANVNQGGIGDAKLKIHTEEVCNLKAQASK